VDTNNFSIKSWADDDRPREKLMLKGKIALTDSELLAILIGSGSRNETAVSLCQRILKSVDNNLNALGKLSIQQLSDFKGIGEAKAISIIAAMEIGRRRRAEHAAELVKITSSRVIFEIMQPIIGELMHEEFWILYLNNANKVLAKTQISKGGITATLVDKRIVFKNAFEHNAVSMILAHNHPSGKLEPSNADLVLTKELQMAASQLDIAILDHIIVTENAYYSFADDNNI
jgi:DNA repair protein RadC